MRGADRTGGKKNRNSNWQDKYGRERNQITELGKWNDCLWRSIKGLTPKRFMGVFAFCTQGWGHLGAKWDVCVCVSWTLVTLLKRLTFASSLYLTHTVQSVWHQIWEPPIQIHWGQTALEALLSVHQFGQILVHLLGHPSNIKVTCGDSTKCGNSDP